MMPFSLHLALSPLRQRLRRPRALPWLLAAGLLHGCTSTPPSTSDSSAMALRSLEERSILESGIASQPAQTPAAIPLVLAPAPEASAALQRERQPLPTLPVRHLHMSREADIRTVLRALATGAGLNLVLGNGVTGQVQFNLAAETTWDRLFEMIMEAHGLHYELDNGLLKVLAQEDIERSTAVERALREREVARVERRRAEPLQVELYRVRYADTKQLAESVLAGLNAVLGEDKNQLTIVPDTASGLIIIQATPTNLARVRHLAESLDQPVYQVLIEASIVQTNSETARDLGMQWGAWFPGRDGNRFNVGGSIFPGSGATVPDVGSPPGLIDLPGPNLNFPAGFGPGEPGFTFGVVRYSARQILQMQLSALQKDGRLHIVASPSITTLDKQTALIESGEERPFQSAQGAGAATTSVVEFKKALLSLEVTPQVIDGNWIKLHIKTTKDDFDDSRAVLIEGTIQVPIITRAATTTLYLADGQTTVIGGLSTASRTNQNAGLPFLKDIPGLGRLFGSTNDRDVLTDTLIFLTPRIISRTAPARPPAESSP